MLREENKKFKPSEEKIIYWFKVPNRILFLSKLIYEKLFLEWIKYNFETP